MDERLSKILVEKFVYDKYLFRLCGDMLDELSYKVTCLTYNKVDPIQFYNDIMYDEKINFYLGLRVDSIIVDKKAYIKIVEESNSYYMILSIKTISIMDYYNNISQSAPILTIGDNFNEISIGKHRYPISTIINEIKISDNSFCNKYHVSINIFNIKDRDIDSIINQLYTKVMYDIGNVIKLKIDKRCLLKIGLDYKFIIVYGYKSLKIAGFIVPKSIDDIEVLSITSNSIIIGDPISESVEVEDNTTSCNINEIIPCIYNTQNLLYYPKEILNKGEVLIKGDSYTKINFNTLLFVLHNEHIEMLKINDSESVLNFVPYKSMYNNKFSIYKTIDRHTDIQYCGYIDYSIEKLLFKHVDDDKEFKKCKVEIFSRDVDKSYFIIIKNKSNFKLFL